MIAPPLPGFYAEPPPDPDTLPPPPALQWEALPPAAEEGSTPAPRPVLSVPPPHEETELPPPPVPAIATAVGASDSLEKGTAEVEVWREESEFPQVRSRGGTRFEKAYIAGDEPVLVRLQFDPLAAGKAVIVRPGSGVTVEPPETEFEVGPAGECVISVRLTGELDAFGDLLR